MRWRQQVGLQAPPFECTRDAGQRSRSRQPTRPPTFPRDAAPTVTFSFHQLPADRPRPATHQEHVQLVVLRREGPLPRALPRTPRRHSAAGTPRRGAARALRLSAGRQRCGTKAAPPPAQSRAGAAARAPRQPVSCSASSTKRACNVQHVVARCVWNRRACPCFLRCCQCGGCLCCCCCCCCCCRSRGSASVLSRRRWRCLSQQCGCLSQQCGGCTPRRRRERRCCGLRLELALADGGPEPQVRLTVRIWGIRESPEVD
jgi:hypothetical protein